MENYRCAVFGYVDYSERVDPNFCIKPGLPLEELPEVCVCSEWGTGKTNLRRSIKKE